MKTSFKRYARYIKRNFLADIALFRFVAVWSFLSVIFFGFFGVRPLIMILIEKSKTIHEMEKVNSNLGSNLETYDSLSQDLMLAGRNLEYLDVYMPNTSKVQNFLVEFSGAVSASGFTVRSFGVSEIPNSNKITISVNLLSPDGKSDYPLLINNIEELKRITTIDSISGTFAQENKSGEARLELEIYYIKDVK